MSRLASPSRIGLLACLERHGCLSPEQAEELAFSRNLLEQRDEEQRWRRRFAAAGEVVARPATVVDEAAMLARHGGES